MENLKELEQAKLPVYAHKCVAKIAKLSLYTMRSEILFHFSSSIPCLKYSRASQSKHRMNLA
jgi:hypothetical protein